MPHELACLHEHLFGKIKDSFDKMYSIARPNVPTLLMGSTILTRTLISDCLRKGSNQGIYVLN